MKFEDFKKVLDNIRRIDDTIDKMRQFGIDVGESPILDAAWIIEDVLLEEVYTSEGKDWIYWYLYEQPHFQKLIDTLGDSKEYHAWDADGNPIDLSTDEKLWELLEKDYGKK